MANTSGVSTAISESSPAFGPELRRWRTLRRVSQLELANRAGTTQRHLSFMEQGRSQPGRAIVLRLAESLRLTLRERNALLFSAGYAPAYEETSYDSPAFAPVREAMERVIEGHLPYPALVLRRPGRVITANRAFSVFLEGCAPHLLTPPIDLLRVMLHPDGIAPRVLNLAQWGRHVIDNLRLLAVQSPDRGLDALVEELAEYVPDAPADQTYLGFAVPMRLRVPEGELRLMTALTSFATAVDVTVSESVLESFLPADAESAEILAARDRLAAERGEPRLLAGL